MAAKKAVLVSLLAAPALVLALFGAVAELDVADSTQPFSYQPTGEILPARIVGQTFTGTANGLYRVDVLLATYARRNDCRIVFRLYDMQSGLELATIAVPGSDVEDNSYRSFVFPEMANSSGRSYQFAIESPDAAPGRAVTALAMGWDIYPGGSRLLNGEDQPGDLAFKTYYRTSASAMALERVVGNKPGILGSKALYPLVAAAYVLGLSATVLAAARVR